MQLKEAFGWAPDGEQKKEVRELVAELQKAAEGELEQADQLVEQEMYLEAANLLASVKAGFSRASLGKKAGRKLSSLRRNKAAKTVLRDAEKEAKTAYADARTVLKKEGYEAALGAYETIVSQYAATKYGPRARKVAKQLADKIEQAGGSVKAVRAQAACKK